MVASPAKALRRKRRGGISAPKVLWQKLCAESAEALSLLAAEPAQSQITLGKCRKEKQSEHSGYDCIEQKGLRSL